MNTEKRGKDRRWAKCKVCEARVKVPNLIDHLQKHVKAGVKPFKNMVEAVG